MSVTIRPYKRGNNERGVEVDIRFTWPDGETYRERLKSPVSSKSGARSWGQQRLQELLKRGKVLTQSKAPTLGEFAPRYIDQHARANRQRPSTILQKQQIIDFYLVPSLGALRLDEIVEVEVQRLKGELERLKPKTVNNILVVLSTMLKTAVAWGLIQRLPVTVRLLKVPPTTMAFYEEADFERLVAAAEAISIRHKLVVLLGGEAGLRCGEILALEQTDIDVARGQLHVRRSEHRGHLTAPKNGRERIIEMTERLKATLQANRHLRGPRVLWRDDGHPKVTQVLLAKWMRRIQRQAGMEVNGRIHILRHTFCSRLAMAGAPGKSIQELAGHQNLSTTQRYMHLSRAAKSEAIRLLETRRSSTKAASDVG